MHKKQPLVSILMANYNNGKYLKEAIQSVFNQTYTNWEVIIVDDASTDNSWDIIKDLPKKHDNIYSCQNEINLKVAATKARATELSNGEICAILDPDDTLVNTALEKHVAVYLNNPNCSMVSSKYFFCDAKLNIEGVNKDVFNPELNYSYLSSSGGVNAFWSFKKECYDQSGGFDAKFVLAEDQDLYYKLEEVGDLKVIDVPLYYYRIHQNSISKNDNLANAYAYHLLAMFDAKYRRSKNKEESNSIKLKALHFMTWGIMKIKKQMRLQLFSKIVISFPQLLFKRTILSALWGVIKKKYD
tara:strand:+ start:828 stop:1727 length:900 start_codon:yes stop_codon:yes gene_type:complete